MKKYLISLILLICIAGLLWGITTAMSNAKKEKASSNLDTSLDTFKNSESLALFYLDYLTMQKDSEYQSLKKRMGGKMSGDLFAEYFGLETYEIFNKNTKVDLHSVGGHTYQKNHYEFKIDYTLSGGGRAREMVAYIEVKNNVITSMHIYNTY